MESPTMTRQYLYAFVRSEDIAAIQSEKWNGLFGEPIRTESIGPLAVVFSDISVETIRPKRQLLSDHQRIVAEISKRWDMLPVAFGLIASDEDELRSIVSNNVEQLAEELDRVSGMVEMGLVIRWVPENVFQYLVSQHPDLQTARDELVDGQASREEMIELGRSFEAILRSERADHQSRISAALEGVCDSIDMQAPKDEHEIVRANCLIARDAEHAFGEAIEKAATSYSNDFSFAFNGPWPPYSFVNLKLSREE